MSCWVAPTIAADLWGVSLVDVLSLIRTGHLPIQQNGGFSFVRLASPSERGKSLPATERPKTFNLISSSDSDAVPSSPVPVNQPVAEDPNESELGPPPDEDPSDNRIADWRAGRRAASGRRRPPGK